MGLCYQFVHYFPGEMSPGKVSAGRKVAITTSDTTPVVQAAEKTEVCVLKLFHFFQNKSEL